MEVYSPTKEVNVTFEWRDCKSINTFVGGRRENVAANFPFVEIGLIRRYLVSSIPTNEQTSKKKLMGLFNKIYPQELLYVTSKSGKSR